MAPDRVNCQLKQIIIASANIRVNVTESPERLAVSKDKQDATHSILLNCLLPCSLTGGGFKWEHFPPSGGNTSLNHDTRGIQEETPPFTLTGGGFK